MYTSTYHKICVYTVNVHPDLVIITLLLNICQTLKSCNKCVTCLCTSTKRERVGIHQQKEWGQQQETGEEEEEEERERKRESVCVYACVCMYAHACVCKRVTICQYNS